MLTTTDRLKNFDAMQQLGQSIAGLRRSEHITNALASFHWLREHPSASRRRRRRSLRAQAEASMPTS